MKGIKTKHIKMKYFIYPFLLVSIFYVYVIYGVLMGWIENNVNHNRDDAVNIARVYGKNIEKSLKAKQVLNQLMDERLMAASNAVRNRNYFWSNDIMESLAQEMNLDVVYAYNTEGEIIYANTEEYIGWVAPKNHIVRNFMESGEQIRIGELRKDTLSQKYYKYSYARLDGGEFYQLGVLADQMAEYTNEFEISELLIEIGSDYAMTYGHYIDLDHVVQESTKESMLGDIITDEKAIVALQSDEEYSLITTKDKSNLEVYVPIYVDQVKEGTLVIGKEVDPFVMQTQRLVQDSIWILVSMVIGTMVFALLMYRESKKHLNLAYYDQLTNLPNDTFMKEFLKKKLITKKPITQAIFLINIQNFRTINLALGYEIGDQVIKEVASRLNLV